MPEFVILKELEDSERRNAELSRLCIALLNKLKEYMEIEELEQILKKNMDD